MKEIFLNVEDTAKLLGVSKGTLNQWRLSCKVLPYYKTRGKVFYSTLDIYNVLKKNTVKVATC